MLVKTYEYHPKPEGGHERIEVFKECDPNDYEWHLPKGCPVPVGIRYEKDGEVVIPPEPPEEAQPCPTN